MNNIRLSGAVISHHRRIDLARSLIGSLAPEPLELVLDPDPEGPPTALRTMIKAWSSVPEDSTHHLVLEDDAVPSTGFLGHVARAAGAAPHAAIAFYTNWHSRNGAAVRIGALAGARWAAAVDEYTPTVALLLPASVGRGFAAYARRASAALPDDILMMRYLRQAGVPTYLTVPNLVEQRDVPSTVGNNFSILGRAACYGALPVDTSWDTAGITRPDVVPVFDDLAQCLLQDAPDERWQPVHAGRCFRRLGMDIDTCHEDLATALSSSGELFAGLEARLNSSVLGALWQTAYLLGALGRMVNRRRSLSETSRLWATDPLVATALRTLGLGGISDGLRIEEIPRLEEPLRAFAHQALLLGAHRRERGASSGIRRTRPRVSIAFGDDDPLGRYLAADLTDRGYPVVPVDVRSGGNVEQASSDVLVEIATRRPGPPSPPGRFHAERADAPRPRNLRHVIRLEVPVIGAPAQDPDNDQPYRVVAGTAPPVLTRLRLAVPYGPLMYGYSPLIELIRDMFAGRPVKPVQPPPPPFQLVHVWDIADVVERVIVTERTSATYDICQTDPMTADQLAAAVLANPHRVPDGPSAVPAVQPLDGDAARRYLGWSPGVDLHHGIGTTALWLLYGDSA